MRLTKEYMGTVSLTPSTPVTAGEYGTWVLTFTAGEYGIDDGGSLVVAWRSVSDWDTPQFDEPSQSGYTTVSTTGNCNLRPSYHKFIRPFGNSILIDVTKGFIKKGDVIRLVLGDTSGGSLGMRAQSFCEREHEFRVYLDPCGTNRYEEMPDRPFVKIVPGWHHELQALVPGSVKEGEEFPIHLRVLDEFGNPTGHYSGDVFLTVHGCSGENIPDKVHFPADTNGTFTIEHCQLKGRGPWTLEIEDPVHYYHAFSNASYATAPDEQRSLFWGDMHGQTKDTVGTGFLEDYYQFARDKAFVDFTGWQGNDFEITEKTWQSVRSYTKQFNKEHQFLVFLGYEWSGTTPQGGDHNVYFLDDNEFFYPSSNWTSREGSLEQNANPLPELFEKLHNRKDVLLIPHVGGRYANLDYLNPDFTSVIEIHSHHGTFEWFAMDAMRKHLKVGFIAASDDHTCRVGLSYPLSGHGKSASGAFDVASGFTGVYARELTKPEIWKAIKARHCYASTFDRLYLDTEANGVRMGDEGTTREPVRFSFRAGGTFPLESLYLYDWDQLVLQKDFLPRDRKKVRIRWSGVVYRGRGKSARWDGMVYVRNGKINTARTYAFDRIDQGIRIKSDKYVQFTSSTSGDYDGLLLDLETQPDTVLEFSSEQGHMAVPYAELMKHKVTKAMGGLNLKVEMEAAFEEVPEEKRVQTLFKEETLQLPYEKGEHAYWVKILQTNGNAAWSSPVFLNVE
jgi:hypothetical protein